MNSRYFSVPIIVLAAVVLSMNSTAPKLFAEDLCDNGQSPAFQGSNTCILDPGAIPKYVTPLVIPPVMNNNGTAESYDIAVRQFKQQILPGGIWNTVTGRSDAFPATTVWSYGPDEDGLPDSTALGGGLGVAPAPNSQFNYPAFTMETTSNVPVSVRWINDLKENFGAGPGYLQHILPVDQTLHWANPDGSGCMHGGPTDCSTNKPGPYTGPVPIVTHVHGAHVDPHSDGYPEAWWLPGSYADYFSSGTLFDDATGFNQGNLGYADYLYRQDQPATTLWYHDHTLGMTRLNVYAGPAGFWLIRQGMYDVVLDSATGKKGTLPGPAPKAGQAVLDLNLPTGNVRSKIREIPIVIQDRSFKPNGDLFYPDNRAFFEGLNPEQLQIDFVPESDIAPTWNPEAFFSTMVVNGVTWPQLDVAQAMYRFRLLNGCNSRFLNLSLRIVTGPGGDGVYGTPDDTLGGEIPFFQIGAEQGFLPKVVRIETGYATMLPGNRTIPSERTAAADPEQALLMALAERADVLVDFSGIPNGTVVRMINTAPDAPFGGFGDDPANPDTTGQVMQFVVNATLNGSGQTDPLRPNGKPNPQAATSPYNLILPAEPTLATLQSVAAMRNVSLNEGESEEVCVEDQGDDLVQIECPEEDPPFFGPKEALLGTVDLTGSPAGIPLKWTDMSGVSKPATVWMANGTPVDIMVTENPKVGNVEDWEIYNFTMDAHPIHLHLVRFNVIERRSIDGSGKSRGPEPWEAGYKDTVIAYPGEITTVRALFDIPGLYVWHCHIVEHEDNEMMRPYVVSP